MRAVIYARYSTELQTESSIADQFRVCREYAAGRGWTIVAEHADRGISGAALGNRPGAQAAIAADADVLLVIDLSRLARSQDLSPLIAQLRHRGVRVIGIQDGFDSDSRTARMQAGMSGIMSEEFRAMVADRTRAALETRAKDGRPTGGKAYGEPAIVREIFERFAAGESMRAIASDLNRRNVPSPGSTWNRKTRRTDGRWLISTLNTLLQNERYAGRQIWNRSQWVKHPVTGKRERRERPESEWIVRPCEALIDAATWEAAQARFRRRKAAPRAGRPTYVLSGLLVCALCGSRLVVYGGRQRRYVCGTYHAGGEHACSNRVTFTRRAAEDVILGHVRERMLSPKAIAAGIRLLREERAAAEGEAVIDNPARRELAELERLVREGILSAGIAAPAIAEARRKAKTPPALLPWPTEELWKSSVEAMGVVLEGPDVDAAREVLRGLVGEVKCSPSTEGYVLAQVQERRLRLTGTGPVSRLVAGVGFEPTTFGL